ncbi:hypothetical protein A1Q2_03529 [Trichosporon asahii var. asahii CBS 8904]|uniref:Uncharacterized protein n=1 Tax=Trichosporon asahii var. asahii (strain CBS 8904) TaxID=1220162 RepID=K1VRS3_TRIAC|nr:hypothetical protein A1Q2_03529 [Trichosporon asahii var. asahii CBS 8904]
MPRLQAQDAPYTPSEAPEDVIIVRLGAPTGSNNFNSTGADGVERLVELPAKIRKMTLASRGMFAPSTLDTQQQPQQRAGDSDELPENPNRRRQVETDSEADSSEEESSDEE